MTKTGPKGTRRVRVEALARPEPDLKKLAQVLLGVAKDIQAEQVVAGVRQQARLVRL
jgi:hypothetical protein